MTLPLPTNNQSLFLHAPHDLRWVAAPLPTLGPDDLLVTTLAGAISSGTELPLYAGTARNAGPPAYPLMTGYESLAVVRARGSAVQGHPVGSRIVSTYGHRDHAIVPAQKAIPVPTGISDEAALLLILSGDVATGIRRLGPTPASALVTGAGTIGLLAVFVLAALGTPVVDVVEPDRRRHAIARLLGARHVVTPLEQRQLASIYTAGVECSSNNAAFQLLQEHLRPFSPLCIIADGNLEPLTLALDFHQQQLQVFGTSDCPDYHTHAAWYWPLARRHQQRLAQIFTTEVPASDLSATFASLTAKKLEAIKVRVRYYG